LKFHLNRNWLVMRMNDSHLCKYFFCIHSAHS
jgi:hypothetical protein